ncbi:MAG TPA: CPBP family intramembrane glutamic endopeptidase, partial [Ktedonobacteraceae bacterium]|nr:CPBP family intramembrane glutamic endopeptidase [Ktedonobacteraceae bacterium]
LSLLRHWSSLFSTYLLPLGTLYLVGAVGEEIGWRGFALPRLQQRYGPLRGSLLLGILWAGWHLPGYVTPAGSFSFASVVLNGLFITLLTMIITWIFNGTQGSILIVILFHAAANANRVFISTIVPIFPPLSSLIALVLILGCFVLILVGTKGRLAYQADCGIF